MSVRADDRHLQASEMAAYIDRTDTSAAREFAETHLSTCAACRGEAAVAWRIVRKLPADTRARSVWRRVWFPAAAAAAALLLLQPWTRGNRENEALREGALTTIIAPRPSTPIGMVDSATTLRWSFVPAADRYRARLFDANGTVLWEDETHDTIAVLPARVRLESGRAYYWKVEAVSTRDRGASSDLMEFEVRASPRPSPR